MWAYLTKDVDQSNNHECYFPGNYNEQKQQLKAGCYSCNHGHTRLRGVRNFSFRNKRQST